MSCTITGGSPPGGGVATKGPAHWWHCYTQEECTISWREISVAATEQCLCAGTFHWAVKLGVVNVGYLAKKQLGHSSPVFGCFEWTGELGVGRHMAPHDVETAPNGTLFARFWYRSSSAFYSPWICNWTRNLVLFYILLFRKNLPLCRLFLAFPVRFLM